MTRTTAAILASAAMTLAPIGAQAAERQASPLAESEQLGGSEPISIIAIVVGLAAAIAVVRAESAAPEPPPSSLVAPARSAARASSSPLIASLSA